MTTEQEAAGLLRPRVRARRLRRRVRRRPAATCEPPRRRPRPHGAREPRPPGRLRRRPRDRRRRRGARPAAAPALPGGRRLRAARARGAMARGWRSCLASRGPRAAGDASSSRRSPARRGSSVLGWREVPVDLAAAGEAARTVAPRFSQVFLAAGAGRPRGWTPTASSGAASSCASASSTRTRERLLPVAVDADLRLQGDARSPDQLRRFFPDLDRRAPREPHRARALAVLDQHVPVLAARPPVPPHRPQRRDQHPRRATATGCAPARRCSRATSIPGRPRADLPDRHAGRERLGLLRRGARAAAPRRAARFPTRC